MQKKWDRTADMIIIGAGTAGLYAAIEARKAGESLLVLEKMRDAEWRSSIPVIAGVVDFAGTKYQEEPSGISVRIQTRLPCKSDDKERV